MWYAIHLWFKILYGRSLFEPMELRLGLKMTFSPSFKRRSTLDRRYHLVGLALPTFLTVYFLVFGELILSRPEGFAVLW
jgi:hypothetical protein